MIIIFIHNISLLAHYCIYLIPYHLFIINFRSSTRPFSLIISNFFILLYHAFCQLIYYFSLYIIFHHCYFSLLSTLLIMRDSIHNLPAPIAQQVHQQGHVHQHVRQDRGPADERMQHFVADHRPRRVLHGVKVHQRFTDSFGGPP